MCIPPFTCSNSTFPCDTPLLMCHPVAFPCPLGLADKKKKSPAGVAAEEKPFPKYPVQFAAFIGPLIAIEREKEGGFGFSRRPQKFME